MFIDYSCNSSVVFFLLCCIPIVKNYHIVMSGSMSLTSLYAWLLVLYGKELWLAVGSLKALIALMYHRTSTGVRLSLLNVDVYI